jgi:hypothetical protein
MFSTISPIKSSAHKDRLVEVDKRLRFNYNEFLMY